MWLQNENEECIIGGTLALIWAKQALILKYKIQTK
jgi:hypothetical protein